MKMEIYLRALQLNDDKPDHICPGCGEDITGWQQWEAHYPPGTDLAGYTPSRADVRSMPLPFTKVTSMSDARICEWTQDYLTARRHRRRLIAGDDRVPL